MNAETVQGRVVLDLVEGARIFRFRNNKYVLVDADGIAQRGIRQETYRRVVELLRAADLSLNPATLPSGVVSYSLQPLPSQETPE